MKPSDRWGKSVVIQNCIVGRNLNSQQVIGYASLDFLADISSADVFDQTLNPMGTQRPLVTKHVKEAFEYAAGAVAADPEEDPRAFSAIILNVRDKEAVSFLVDGDIKELDDIDLSEQETMAVDLQVNIEALRYPPMDYSPQISRVDGNHRLSGVPELATRDLDSIFPSVFFCIFIGLENDQERKIFADINGKQAQINTSHLRQIVLQKKGDDVLLDEQTRAQWFAKYLSTEERIFSGLIYMGGEKKGIKGILGANPPLTFTGLVTICSHTLKKLDSLLAKSEYEKYVADAKSGSKESFASLLETSSIVARLLEHYWVAVKSVFPEAWADIKKKNHILFESAGSVALSWIAADIIEELVEAKTVEAQDFVRSVERMKSAGVTLKKGGELQGAAGLSGAKRIYGYLAQARADGETGLRAVKTQLLALEKSKLED